MSSYGLLGAAGSDRATVWDAATRKIIRVLPVAEFGASAIAFSPDRTRLALGEIVGSDVTTISAPAGHAPRQRRQHRQHRLQPGREAPRVGEPRWFCDCLGCRQQESRRTSERRSCRLRVRRVVAKARVQRRKDDPHLRVDPACLLHGYALTARSTRAAPGSDFLAEGHVSAPRACYPVATTSHLLAG